MSYKILKIQLFKYLKTLLAAFLFFPCLPPAISVMQLCWVQSTFNQVEFFSWKRTLPISNFLVTVSN